jgi:soluble lytic murein transglycosylase
LPNKEFYPLLLRIVTNPAMPKAQRSFLSLDNNLIQNLKYRSIFLLAINAIYHNDKKDALRYLQLAYKKAYYKMQQDNVLFWQYRLTNQEQYLKQLASSWDINIYSLYAKEKTKTKINNIIYTINLPKTNEPQRYKYDVSNPFDWIKALSKMKKLNQNSIQYFQNLFSTSDKVGHLAFVLERYYGYKKSYFITPYEKMLQKYHKVNKPLLYAIIRQESRFIPSSISNAYAMGVMQIMPFLSKAIAKQLKESYNIFDQLKVEKIEKP